MTTQTPFVRDFLVTCAGILAAVVIAFGGQASELKRDQYLLALTESLKAEDYRAALPVVEKLLALDVELPEGTSYFFAEVFFYNCEPEQAEAYLNEYYLQTAKDGRYYREMLQLLQRIEEGDFTSHCNGVLNDRQKQEAARNLEARCGPSPVFKSQPNTAYAYKFVVRNRNQFAKDLADEIGNYCENKHKYDVQFCSDRGCPPDPKKQCVRDAIAELKKGVFWFQKRQKAIDYLRCVENPSLSIKDIVAARSKKKQAVEANSFRIALSNACSHPVDVAVVWFDATTGDWSNKKQLPGLVSIQPGKTWTAVHRDGSRGLASKTKFYLHYQFTRGKRLHQVESGLELTIKDAGSRHFKELVAKPNSDGVDTTTIRC